MTDDSPNGASGRLRFDPVVTWGHLIIVIGIFISGIGVYAAGEVRASGLDFRVRALEVVSDRYLASSEKVSDQLSEIKIELATMKARLPLLVPNPQR